ncbi:MAG: hypothetical protein ABIQ02_16495 [Saprospiraceae bacterium]
MNYRKIAILLLCFSQLAMLMCKSDGSNTGIGNLLNASKTGSSFSRETFLKATESSHGGTAIDSNVLKDALPKTVNGLNRVSISSHNADYQGTIISNSTAIYNKDDKTLKAYIIDLGNSNKAIPDYAPWTKIQYENIRADGYEKSKEEEGNKFFEKFDSTTHESTLIVIYNQRIVLSLSSKELSIGELHLLTK